MKILEIKKTDKYQQMTIQKQFLFIKWEVTYRKISNCIFVYCGNNKYKEVGIYEHLSIIDMFKIEFME